MKYLRIVCCSLLLLSHWYLDAIALRPGADLAQPVPQPDRIAVLVGIDRVGEINVVSSMRKLGELLRNSFGYRPDNVIELYASDATRDKILAAVFSTLRRAGERDSLLLFIQVPRIVRTRSGASYVIPQQGNRDDERTLVSLTEIVSLVADLPTQSSLIVFPGCGSFPQAVDECLGSKQSNRPIGGKSFVSYCAGAPGPPVVEGLLIQLRALAADPQTELSIQDIYSRVWSGADTPTQLARCPSYSDWFVFAAESRHFAPYLRTLRDSVDGVTKIAAIAALAAAVRSESGDARRSATEEAGQMLVGLVETASESDAVRATAVSALGEIRYSASIVPRLANVLAGASDPTLRRNVVNALALIGGDAARMPVRTALQDGHPEVQLAAVRAIGQLDDVFSGDRLLLLLNHPNVALRMTTLQVLGRLTARPQNLGDAIKPLLHDAAPDVRREAVVTLGRIGWNLARVDALELLLSDPAASVREATAYAIGRQSIAPSDRQAVEDALLSATRTKNDDAVRAAAAWALGRVASERATRKLEGLLADRNEVPDVRRAAAEALGQIGRVGIVGALGNALRDDTDSSVRSTAASALGLTGQDIAISVLLKALGSEREPAVRREIELALRSMKADVQGSSLAAHLKDGSARVRLAAIRRLGVTTDPKALEALLQCLGDQEYEVRQAAILVVGQYRDSASLKAIVLVARSEENLSRRLGAIAALGFLPEGVDTLLGASYDVSAVVRAEAVSALGSLAGSPINQSIRDQVEDTLVEKAGDLDSSVRVAVARSLGRIASSKARSALDRLAEDPNSSIRQEALYSLFLVDEQLSARNY